MSGIVGIANTDGQPVDRVLLETMTRTMAFRGPDAQDLWQDGTVGLGHALLRTTFEAQRERGPCSLDGHIWLAADARVDGRRALIAELRSGGRPVADDAPDPELILHAYATWGDACLDHLIGDFAFALWDGRQQRLFCARDHFGVVPFYYADRQGTLIFGNTLHALRLHPAISDELNDQFIADCLLRISIKDPEATAFADVRLLPPAHVLTWSAARPGIRVQPYWCLDAQRDYLHYRDRRAYVERFLELFRLAVGDRLRTGRVGAQLSGGLDSTSIAAVAHALLSAAGEPFDLQTYTVAYDWLIPHEEGRYAQMVAEQLGVPNHQLTGSAHLLADRLDGHGYLAPSPAEQGAAPEDEGTMRGAAAARGRVLLSGQGGDPIMKLSPTYWLDLLRGLRIGQLATDVRQYVSAHGSLPHPGLRSRWRRRRRRPEVAPYPRWLAPHFAERLSLRQRWETRWLADPPETGQLSMAAYTWWSRALSAENPDATGLPLETRFPFFDVRLLAYLARVPPILWASHKAFLREAMRGILPEPVRLRQKSPLSDTPLHVFACRQGPPRWAEELCGEPELGRYVDQKALLRLIRSPREVSAVEYRTIRRPLNLALWLRTRRQLSKGLTDEVPG